MQRYFMTIPEASQLVMQAGAIGTGGEVLVLDMGSQVKIVDLARQLIARNGLRADEDIQIRFTGIRPGEKLFEELACDDEQTRPTAHERIRAWQLPPVTPRSVALLLELLSEAAEGSSTQAVEALAHCVPEYRPETLRTKSEDALVLQRVAWRFPLAREDRYPRSGWTEGPLPARLKSGPAVRRLRCNESRTHGKTSIPDCRDRDYRILSHNLKFQASPHRLGIVEEWRSYRA
jgi:hypothetical protein